MLVKLPTIAKHNFKQRKVKGTYSNDMYLFSLYWIISQQVMSKKDKKKDKDKDKKKKKTKKECCFKYLKGKRCDNCPDR